MGTELELPEISDDFAVADSILKIKQKK